MEVRVVSSLGKTILEKREGGRCVFACPPLVSSSVAIN